MPTKSFYRGTTRYEFSYAKDDNDPNPASTFTFDDEEQVRVRYYYPWIKKGDVVFDIGASFGSYTLPALAMGAKVYAFSPEHEFPLINKNVELNDGFKDRYLSFPWGLYSKDGWFKTDTMDFSTDAEVRKQNEGNWTGWWIRVTPLDILPLEITLDRIDFMKVDVEGAELEVLKGGINTIKKYRPKILAELHLFKDGDMQEKMIQYLEPMGYKLKITPYTPAISHCFAWT
jgi:FkbM family methyltransferase